MQTILPADFKRGMVIMVDAALQLIEEFHSSGTAQAKHKLHARLRHLKTGRVVERVFTENDKVPLVAAEHRRVQFSYKKGDSYVFLDTESFDEAQIAADQIGDRHWFLKDNNEFKALFIEGELVDIILPPQVVLQVVETAPPIRGGSDSAWKPAKLDTGLEIMVPLFIAPGELIRVDTSEGKYAGKESHEKS